MKTPSTAKIELIRWAFDHFPPLARTVEICRREGVGGGLRNLGYHTRRYRRWVDRNRLTPQDREDILKEIGALRNPLRVSIVMPVHDIAPAWLVRAVESVRRQFYPYWELCIVDDASTHPRVRNILSAYRRRDPRIRVVFLDENQGISGASNAALKLAGGTFVGFLDHDDELSPEAIYETVRLLGERPDTDMVYSDEDKLNRFGRRCDPFFKPDWSPEMLSSCMYTCHFGVYRRSILSALDGFRTGFEGVQDYDLALRFTEKTQRVAHLPRVLYHWRKIHGSLAASTRSKVYGFDRARRALTESLKRRGVAGRVEDGFWTGSFRLRYDIPERPLVSVLIAVPENPEIVSPCLEKLISTSRYRRFEAILVTTRTDSETRSIIRRFVKRYHRAECFSDPGGGTVSAAWNRAVAAVQGSVLLFLDARCIIAEDQSLEAMLEHAQQAPIAAVGARVTVGRDRFYHCGLVLGLGPDGLVGAHSQGFPASDHGYFGRNSIVHNVSAVGGGVMMVRRDCFERAGGFDPHLGGRLAATDLCLKLRDAGYRNVFTPYAHFDRPGMPRPGEERDRTTADQRRRFRERWRTVIENGDPYYNPNLTRDRPDFSPRL